MIERKSEGLLVVLSGPSGVGKGTICKEIVSRLNAWVSVSMTTRGMRDGEEDGLHYYFVTKEEFEERIASGLLLEHALYNGNYYGTPKDKIMEKMEGGTDCILEIEVQGGKQVKELFPDSILIFVAPPSMDVLRERLLLRNTESLDVVEQRMEIVKKEIQYLDYYDYVVVNNDLKMACEEVIKIMECEKLKASRIKEINM